MIDLAKGDGVDVHTALVGVVRDANPVAKFFRGVRDCRVSRGARCVGSRLVRNTGASDLRVARFVRVRIPFIVISRIAPL